MLHGFRSQINSEVRFTAEHLAYINLTRRTIFQSKRTVQVHGHEFHPSPVMYTYM